MALRAKYTKPYQVVDTPQMKEVLKAMADREEISLAAVVRRLVRKGLAAERGGA